MLKLEIRGCVAIAAQLSVWKIRTDTYTQRVTLQQQARHFKLYAEVQSPKKTAYSQDWCRVSPLGEGRGQSCRRRSLCQTAPLGLHNLHSNLIVFRINLEQAAPGTYK